MPPLDMASRSCQVPLALIVVGLTVARPGHAAARCVESPPSCQPAITKDDPLTPLEETLRTLDQFVRAGKIRYWGLSNFTG